MCLILRKERMILRDYGCVVYNKDKVSVSFYGIDSQYTIVEPRDEEITESKCRSIDLVSDDPVQW